MKSKTTVLVAIAVLLFISVAVVQYLHRAAAAELAKVLSIRLIEIGMQEAGLSNYDGDNFVHMTLAFTNNGNKTVSGLKGILTFKDKFGDIVSEIPI